MQHTGLFSAGQVGGTGKNPPEAPSNTTSDCLIPSSMVGETGGWQIQWAIFSQFCLLLFLSGQVLLLAALAASIRDRPAPSPWSHLPPRQTVRAESRHRGTHPTEADFLCKVRDLMFGSRSFWEYGWLGGKCKPTSSPDCHDRRNLILNFFRILCSVAQSPRTTDLEKTPRAASHPV